MPIKDILQPDLKFHLTGILRIESAQGRFFGPGRLELLEHIDTTGSISKAAKQMGMSYKKAWDMVQSMNQQTRKPIVLTHAGGDKGGGATVTKEGKELINAFNKIYAEFQNSLDKKMLVFLKS